MFQSALSATTVLPARFRGNPYRQDMEHSAGCRASKARQQKQPAPRTLLNILQDEMAGHVKGGIYHKIQIDLTYNSNHIEGSRLTHDQTRYIYETNTIGIGNGVVNVDDVVETANHFKCIDMVIRDAKKPITEALIKKLHFTLKSGTSDSRKDWFAVGEYKNFRTKSVAEAPLRQNWLPHR